MNGDHNPGAFSLDEILSDVQRMSTERGEAEREENYVPRQNWTAEEIDRLLGQEDYLAGISDYPPDIPETPEPEQVKVEENRYGQVQFEEPAQPEETLPEQEAADDLVQDEKAQPKTKPVPELSALSGQPADGKTKVVGRLPFIKKKTQPREEPNEMVDGQIVMQGFESEEKAEQIDEAQAEQELNERRSKQVKSFKLLDIAEKYEPDLPPKEDIFEEKEPGTEAAEETKPPFSEDEEYLRLGDRMRIGKNLQENRRSAFLSVCALTVLEIVLIVLSVIAGRTQISVRSTLYAVCIILLSVAGAACASTIASGIKALLRLKPNCDTAVALTSAVTLIHGLVAFALPDAEGISCTFCAAAVLGMLLNKLGKLFASIGILDNFKFCAFSHAEKLHDIRPFAEKSDSFEIGKNLMVSDPDLRYSEKTDFPSDFLKNSDFRNLVDRLCRILLPAALGAAVITALAGWISTKSGLGAFSAFTGALCIAMPAGAAFTVTVPCVLLMQHLNRHGGMIVSPSAAEANADYHAVALDAADLYDTKRCDMDGFKDYGAIRVDDVFLYAAAMTIEANGPLADAFRRIVGNPEILPPVKSLIFEEKLGLSAYIHGQSVLLGNRNLLINHSIEAPPKSVEMKHLQRGKRVLYLAVGNKLATMFVVSYVENDALAPSMHILQDNGIGLVVHAPDCNVTEEFINEGFDLVSGSVKLMSPMGGGLLKLRRKAVSEHTSAKLLHSGTTESLLRTLASAVTIRNIDRVAAFIAILGCGIGWLVGFILMLLKGVGAFNWIFVTVYTALWIAVSTTLGVLRMRKAKK